MSPVVGRQGGQVEVSEVDQEASQRAYARLAGLMYLVVLALDVAGVVITSSVSGGGTFADISQRISASEVLYRIGLCAGLFGALSTIVLAVSLYVAVKPADANLALTALLFRVVETAIAAMAIASGFALLQLHLDATRAGALVAPQLAAMAHLLGSGVGTSISAIFFCVGSTIFFYLFWRSRYIPRILAGWGMFASGLYLLAFLGSLILPQSAGLLQAMGSLPILIAELSTALWLLIRGIDIGRSVAPPTVDLARIANAQKSISDSSFTTEENDVERFGGH